MGSKSSKKKSAAPSHTLKTSAVASSSAKDYLFKVMLLGDSSVGKTSFLLRATENTYTESYISSIGSEFKVKTQNFDGKIVKLQVWDTAGQERFKSITSSYYVGARGIILCYDITNRESFDNLAKWLGEVDRYCHGGDVAKIVDSDYQRVVREEDAVEFCDRHNLNHVLSSAKTSEGVEVAFAKLAEELVRRGDE